MKSTTARRFGSNGKSFTAPSAVAPTIGAALLASGTSETADTAWSPAAACLLPDILPVAGTLLSYGGNRQLAAGGTVTHDGALSLGSNTLNCGAITASGLVSANVGITLPVTQKVTFTDSAGSPMSLQAVGFGAIRFGSQFTGYGEFRPGGNVCPYYVGSPSVILATTSAVGYIGIGFGVDAGFSGGYFTLRPAGGTAKFRNTDDSADAPISCGAITASDTIRIRNGLNAQCNIINKSYTSDTSQEALMLDAGKQIAGNLGLYSYRGSAGGSNYPIQIGPLAADGSTFSGLTVLTNGRLQYNYWSNPNAGGALFGWETGLGNGTLQGYGVHVNITGTVGASNVILNAGGIPTASMPGLFASGSTLKVRTATNSADAALTCGAITASDTIRIRNGLTAQCQIINKSYTSDTSQEALMLDAGKQISGNLGLYSYRGSAGGSNYPIRIGMLAADGSTFSGLTVGTDGVISTAWDNGGTQAINCGNNIGLTQFGQHFLLGNKFGAAYYYYVDVDANTGNLRLPSVGCFGITSGNAYSGTMDVTLSRNASGIFQIGTTAANASGSLLLTNLTASGVVHTSSYMTAPSGFYSVGSGGDALGYDFDVSGGLKKHVLSGQVGASFVCFGGTTSAYPAIKRNGTAINLRLGDDSADAALTCGAITASGVVSVNGVTLTGSTLYGLLYSSASIVADGFYASSGSNKVWVSSSYGTRVASDLGFQFGSNTEVSNPPDLQLTRQSAGVLQIGTTSANALGSLACGAITASGNIITGGLTINPANGAVTFGQTFAMNFSTQNSFIVRHGDSDSCMVRPYSTSGAYTPAGYGAVSFGNNVNGIGAYLTPSAAGTLAVKTAAHGDAALTCGAITASDVVTATSSGLSCEVDPVNWRFRLSTSGTSRMDLDQYSLRLVDSAMILWSNTGNNANATKLLGLCKNDTTNYLQINNGTEGTLNGFECGAITASGAITSTGTTDSRLILTNSSYTGQVYTENGFGFSIGTRGHKGIALFNSLSPVSINASGAISYSDGLSSLGENGWRWGGLWTTMVDSSGPICETPTQSSLNPTTTNIPSGKRQGWYNSALSEFRDWVNIGGTLLKSAAYT